VRLGLARQLSVALKAEYVRLADLPTPGAAVEPLAAVVRALHAAVSR
jgi:hypothetical protein